MSHVVGMMFVVFVLVIDEVLLPFANSIAQATDTIVGLICFELVSI